MRGHLRHLGAAVCLGVSLAAAVGAQEPRPRAPEGVKVITGDRREHAAFVERLAGHRFEAVVDCICYRLEDGKAVRTRIQVGLRGGGLVEALKKQVQPASADARKAWEDFTGEERIIKSSLAELKDGEAVRVAAADK